MNRRLWLIGSLIFFLLLLGLLTFQGGIIALVIPLIVYLGMGLFFSPGQVSLTARRTLSARSVSPGTKVIVNLTVTNQGSLVEEILIEDHPLKRLEVTDGETRRFITLASGAVDELEYTVQGVRGSYPFTGVTVTVSDHLGLFNRRQFLPASAHLLVLPKVPHLRSIAIRPLRTQVYTGPIPSRQAGSGISFYKIREYQSGDPLRWINWRISARHQQTLYTTGFEQERIADVGVILDARQQSDVTVTGNSLFEYCIEAAAALAEVFLRDGHRVGLLIYGRGQEFVFPGYSKKQRERILRALARARTGENMALENLGYLPTRFFPPRSQIVMVSALLKGDLPVLTRLPALGYSLLIVSPDPVTFETQHLPDQPGLEMATRLAHIERALMLHRLQRVGIPVVDWRVDHRLDQALHRVLSWRPLIAPRR